MNHCCIRTGLIAPLFLSRSFAVSAQFEVEFPYNPDGNGDGLISLEGVSTSNVGSALSHDEQWNGTNITGFGATLTIWAYGNDFYTQGGSSALARFWTQSLATHPNSWTYRIQPSVTAQKVADSKSRGMSVRCIKNLE